MKEESALVLCARVFPVLRVSEGAVADASFLHWDWTKRTALRCDVLGPFLPWGRLCSPRGWNGDLRSPLSRRFESNLAKMQEEEKTAQTDFNDLKAAKSPRKACHTTDDGSKTCKHIEALFSAC